MIANGHERNVGPLFDSLRCGARNSLWPAVSVTSGPRQEALSPGNQDALKDSIFIREAIHERRRIRSLIGQSRKLPRDLP